MKRQKYLLRWKETEKTLLKIKNKNKKNRIQDRRQI